MSSQTRFGYIWVKANWIALLPSNFLIRSAKNKSHHIWQPSDFDLLVISNCSISFEYFLSYLLFLLFVPKLIPVTNRINERSSYSQKYVVCLKILYTKYFHVGRHWYDLRVCKASVQIEWTMKEKFSNT